MCRLERGNTFFFLFPSKSRNSSTDLLGVGNVDLLLSTCGGRWVGLKLQNADEMNVVAWVTTVCSGASPLLLGHGGEAAVNPPCSNSRWRAE